LSGILLRESVPSFLAGMNGGVGSPKAHLPPVKNLPDWFLACHTKEMKHEETLTPMDT
tara:strand:- start:782 stop:955 length:174 start_codon:yes stop_codon:yes gene_type:complete